MEYIVKAEVRRGMSVEFEIVGKGETDTLGQIVITPYRVDIPLSKMIIIPKEVTPCGT